MPKKYRVNFSIHNTNYNLVGNIASSFIEYIPEKNGKQLFSEWYLEVKEGTVTAFIEAGIIESVTNWIKDKIISDPDWADSLHEECEEINKEYFSYAKGLTKKDFSVFSNEELWKSYKTLRLLQHDGHAKAIATTWFVDSDKEVFSAYLRNELKKHLESLGIFDPVKQVEYFSLLTTPARKNFAQEEQIEFLKLADDILKTPSAAVFRQNEVNEVFERLPSDIQSALRDYYKKWRWTPYGYTGPAFTLDHYIEEIKKHLDVKNLQEVIKEEEQRNEKTALEKERIIKHIRLPNRLKRLFDIAGDIIWLKDFRKYCIWHGHYVLEIINKEIARRLSLSLNQVNYFLPEEVGAALLDGKYDEHILNERYRYSVIHAAPERQKIITGQEARDVINGLDLERAPVDPAKGVKGTVAYPGKVGGIVKIVNSPAEMDKVDEGDVMLSLTTYPALLPAMKKAAAIVTEDGGITCHAAIVARELKVPCVVGTKIATRVLKDGDVVEVDGYKGVVRVVE